MATVRISESNPTNTCELCEDASGKYTCPKCNILYCSLNCYRSQKHLECSELFYHDYVQENISDVGNASKEKMLEILQRTHDDDVLDSDDEEYLDLGERLAGIDLDDPEKVWQNLNSDERQEFETFLRSGHVSKLIPQWNPWWSYCCEDKVFDVEAFEHKSKCPGIIHINDLKNVTNKTPSEVVGYNLINVLAGYAFTLRYFNGEHDDYKHEAVACILKLCLTFKTNHNFESSEDAISSIQNELMNVEWLHYDEENVKLMRDDVERILAGPHVTDKKFYVLCALSDLHKLFKSALAPQVKKCKGIFWKTFPESDFPKVEDEDFKRIKLHIRKVDYFLSYTKDFLC